MALVDDEARLQVAAFQQVVETRAPLVEFGDIASGEVHPCRVEQLDVALVDLRRALVVERRLVVVVALEQFHHVEAGDHLFTVGLKGVPTVRGGGGGMQRQGADAEGQGKCGADQGALHADSTSGQVITHIRPYLRAPGSIGAKQKARQLGQAWTKLTMEAP
ncbi:hypothetical protein D3C84_537550 [compost metagenome]